jgi:hypothetical protein
MLMSGRATATGNHRSRGGVHDKPEQSPSQKPCRKSETEGMLKPYEHYIPLGDSDYRCHLIIVVL